MNPDCDRITNENWLLCCERAKPARLAVSMKATLPTCCNLGLQRVLLAAGRCGNRFETRWLIKLTESG